MKFILGIYGVVVVVVIVFLIAAVINLVKSLMEN
jgi:hypothetical protein